MGTFSRMQWVRLIVEPHVFRPESSEQGPRDAIRINGLETPLTGIGCPSPGRDANGYLSNQVFRPDGYASPSELLRFPAVSMHCLRGVRQAIAGNPQIKQIAHGRKHTSKWLNDLAIQQRILLWDP